MSDLMFVRLREKNENEGETYDYWLQVTSNEEALEELAEALDDESFDEAFTLRMEVKRPEHEVDLLVEEAVDGYMESCQKFTGRLEWPSDQMSLENWQDAIYKGSIEDCFKEED
jgi:hypothetical protein